jgi:hypothetical protein
MKLIPEIGENGITEMKAMKAMPPFPGPFKEGHVNLRISSRHRVLEMKAGHPIVFSEAGRFDRLRSCPRAFLLNS